jgi:four helix bundle protein
MLNKYFENLEIWQEARRLTNSIYKITKNKNFSNDSSLCNQIRQSSLSIMSNIAEGYEQGKTQELSQSLSAAKGSCATVQSQLYIALDQGYIDDVECTELINKFRNLSAAIHKSITHPKTIPHKITDEQPKRGSIKKELEAIFDEVGKENIKSD